VAVWADEVAAVVRSKERDLLKDLRSGPGGFVGVGFTAVSQPRPGAVIESADVSEIATYYELIDPSPRRLVVLGEPGSGKTVAAVQLVLGLLKTRLGLADALRAEQPVPVRVNAAGWDGTAKFSDWLIARLGLDYPQLRPALARKLVEEGLILPVIDGLDEMDTTYSQDRWARELLDHLNNAWRSEPVVVMCRTTEFQRLCRQGGDNGLHGAVTVTLQPLPLERICNYLTGYRDATGTTSQAWSMITTHLTAHRHGPLATVLETPWMLGLGITAMRHDAKTADQLITCTTAEAVEDLLFAAQIPSAVAGREPKDEHRDYTSDDVRTWMQSLAARLDHRREAGADGTAIRLDEIWEIAGSIRCRIVHGLIVGILAAFGGGLMLGLAASLRFGPVVALTVGLTGGLAAGLMFGLMAGLGPAMAHRIVWRLPQRSRWRRGLAAGLMAGLAGGLTMGLETGLAAGLTGGFTGGLTGGLTFGLAVGLTFGLMVDDEDWLRVTVDERRLIREDIAALVLFGVASTSAVGLTVGLAAEVATGTMFTLKVGLIGGPVVGLVVGLLGSISAGRFFTATLIFRFTKAFPARPAAFLDWARRNGLLRANGLAYQFRHETYRQWLQQQQQPLH
jgi:MFS family permease